MSYFRQNDLDVGGDSVTVLVTDASVGTAIPTLLATGDRPKRLRFSTNSLDGHYVKLGPSAVSVVGGAGAATGFLVTRDNDVYIRSLGHTHFAAIDPTTGGTHLCVTPLND